MTDTVNYLIDVEPDGNGWRWHITRNAKVQEGSHSYSGLTVDGASEGLATSRNDAVAAARLAILAAEAQLTVDRWEAEAQRDLRELILVEKEELSLPLLQIVESLIGAK